MFHTTPHHSQHLREVKLAIEAFSFLFLYDTSLDLLLPFHLLSQLEAITPYQNIFYFFLIMAIKIKYYNIKLCARSQLSVKTVHLPKTLSESSQRQCDLPPKGTKDEGSIYSCFMLLPPKFPVAWRSRVKEGKWEQPHLVRVAIPFFLLLRAVQRSQ